jgi:hypothetical protein
MDADCSELDDLVEKHPDRVKTMSEQSAAYARRTGVLPFPASGKKARRKTAGD